MINGLERFLNVFDLYTFLSYSNDTTFSQEKAMA